MTKNYIYQFNIVDGIGTIQNRKQFNADVKQLGNARMVMTLKRIRSKRSNPQNSLIHVYFDIIAKETGNSLERVKNILKSHFLTTDLLDEYDEPVVNPKTGEPITYVRDTSDLKVGEMIEFTENVRMFAMDFGIYLENPNEQAELKFNNLK